MLRTCWKRHQPARQRSVATRRVAHDPGGGTHRPGGRRDRRGTRHRPANRGGAGRQRRQGRGPGPRGPGPRGDPGRSPATSATMPPSRPRSCGWSGELGEVSVLVLNAGIFPIVPFEETTLELWNRTMAINLTGAFLCARRALPGMREAALRAGRRHRLERRQGRRGPHRRRVCGLEGRGHDPDEVDRQRVRRHSGSRPTPSRRRSSTRR